MDIKSLVQAALRARLLTVYRARPIAPGQVERHWRDPRRSYLLLGDDKVLRELEASMAPRQSLFVLI